MEKVLEFIKANSGCTKADITELTGIKGLQLFNVLKKNCKMIIRSHLKGKDQK